MIDGHQAPTANSWDQTAPREAPFGASTVIGGLRATGAMATYTTADTWYPSWASDGSLYSPFTDRRVHGLYVMSRAESPTTGHARIRGQDPSIFRSTTSDAPSPRLRRTWEGTQRGPWSMMVCGTTAPILWIKPRED